MWNMWNTSPLPSEVHKPGLILAPSDLIGDPHAVPAQPLIMIAQDPNVLHGHPDADPTWEFARSGFQHRRLEGMGLPCFRAKVFRNPFVENHLQVTRGRTV
jgi:hypothetical protein